MTFTLSPRLQYSGTNFLDFYDHLKERMFSLVFYKFLQNQIQDEKIIILLFIIPRDNYL